MDYFENLFKDQKALDEFCERVHQAMKIEEQNIISYYLNQYEKDLNTVIKFLLLNPTIYIDSEDILYDTDKRIPISYDNFNNLIRCIEQYADLLNIIINQPEKDNPFDHSYVYCFYLDHYFLLRRISGQGAIHSLTLILKEDDLYMKWPKDKVLNLEVTF